MGASERTPLLSEAGHEAQHGPPSAVVKSRRWLAMNALFAVMLLLATTLIVALCLFFGVFSPHPVNTDPEVCLTPACVHASSEILYNLSPDYKTIDPCTDFETMVCGGWQDRHDLRPDQGEASAFSIISEKSQTLLRHILESAYPEQSEHSDFSPARLARSLASADKLNFVKMKAAYEACMNEDLIKREGAGPLLEIMQNIAKLFPTDRSASLQDSRNDLGLSDHDALADTVLYLAKMGVTSLLSLGAGADDKDPDVVIVQVSPPRSIGLPSKEYYKDSSVVEKYEGIIAQVMEGLNQSHTDENLSIHFAWAERSEGHDVVSFASQSKALAADLVKFEKSLASASPDAEDRNDVTKYYNKKTPAETDDLTPELKVSKILEALVPSNYKPESLIVASPEYMKSLSELLNTTSKEVLRAYFVWKAVQAFSYDVEAEAVKPYKQFRNELQGKDAGSTPERWRECIGHVDNGLGWILSRFFIETAFSAEAKTFGDQIVHDIKDMFIEKLKVTEWMDKSVIDLAIDKVHKIVQKIGYPTESPNIMDPESLLEYYQSVNISTSSFFNNSLSMTKLGVSREWLSLSQPVDRSAWDMTVPTVNAYYNPPGNEIVFPAGIMQLPVFGVDLPAYVSYGAFGSISGHELSHAFDSTGRHYDPDGSYADWWTPRTVAAFEARAACFVEQYHNFTVADPAHPGAPPLHVNGRLTLGENIADAGGVAAAFAAWARRGHASAGGAAPASSAAGGPDRALPGLGFFTREQLFFVSYANGWCGKSRPETAVSRLYSDPHAPRFARVLGTMANSREFRESFGCASREPVCELW